MTPEQVKDEIRRIREIRHDDEMAHSAEDNLHFDVLAAIADGTCTDPVECARLAITTADISFARWCA